MPSIHTKQTRAKKVSGSSKRVAKIKPETLRKLTKPELSKLGLSEKSERYVRKSAKRITKRSPTVSKRAYLNAQRGQTIEAYRKARAPTERVLKVGGIVQRSFKMPLEPDKFDKRLAQIQKTVLKDHKNAKAYFVFDYQDGQTAAGKYMMLAEFEDYETDIEDAAEEGLNQSGSLRTQAVGQLGAISLVVRLT